MEFNGFQELNIAKKGLFSVLAVILNQPLQWYLPKSNFLLGWSRILRYLNNRTLVEADPGPLPTAKIELFVTIVYGSKPSFKVLSQGRHINVSSGLDLH